MKRIVLFFAMVFAGSAFGQSVQDRANLFAKNDRNLIGLSKITGKTPVYQVGINGTVGTSDEEITNLAASYTYPTRAQVVKVVSSSANDDDGGTGVNDITIYGLDDSWDAVEVPVVMNGTDTVATTTKFMRIYDVIVDTVGSGGVSAGTITVYDKQGDSTLASIATGAVANRAQMAMFTVPADLDFYLTFVSGETNLAKATVVSIYARPYGKAWYIVDTFDIYQSWAVSKRYEYPLHFDEKTDITIKANSAGGSGHVTASFAGWTE